MPSSYQDQNNIQRIYLKYKGEIKANNIWKQDPKTNIWAQMIWEWEVEKVLQWETA